MLWLLYIDLPDAVPRHPVSPAFSILKTAPVQTGLTSDTLYSLISKGNIGALSLISRTATITLNCITCRKVTKVNSSMRSKALMPHYSFLPLLSFIHSVSHFPFHSIDTGGINNVTQEPVSSCSRRNADCKDSFRVWPHVCGGSAEER